MDVVIHDNTYTHTHEKEEKPLLMYFALFIVYIVKLFQKHVLIPRIMPEFC